MQALSDEKKQKLKEYSAACSESTGVDQKLIEDARKGIFSEDAKFKEFLFCISKKIGSQNEAGEIQKDVIKQKLVAELKDEKLADSIVEKCAIAKDTPQETAFASAKCYHESKPKHDHQA